MRLLIIALFLVNISAFGQQYSGFVYNSKDKNPIEFVNIGIIGKNIGTTSNELGKYSLFIDSKFDNDTLKISSIGFEQFSIKVSDFKKLSNKNIELKEKYYYLEEVVVMPKILKQKMFGYTSRTKTIRLGFDTVRLGFEFGILLKIKKSAILEKLNFNILTCSYDTIFYRINLYKVDNKMTFENILRNPIYFKIPKDKIKDKITIDLIPYDLQVNGNCLITIESVKDLGKGVLYFSGSFPGKTYYKETSQGTWQTIPVGISYSVDTKIEK